MVNPQRFKAQHFYGFVDVGKDQGGVKVDVRMILRLTAPCESELPALEVRLVPGQLDDLLVSAPDFDFLGWNRTPTSFMLASIGMSIPRTVGWSLQRTSAAAGNSSFFADAPAMSRLVRARRSQILPPGCSAFLEVSGAEVLQEEAGACQVSDSFDS